MPLANRDRWQPIEKAIHDLHRSLGGGVAHAAGDDNRPVSIATAESGTAQVLREAADQANSRSRAECRQKVMVDLVAQSGIADLVEAHELIEAVAPTVRHEQPMEGHGKARLA